jgi:hypothetical protein
MQGNNMEYVEHLTKAVKVLKDARDLISLPGTWTKGFLARNALDKPMLNMHSPEACKFCAVGALEVSSYNNEATDKNVEDIATSCLYYAMSENGWGISGSNDKEDTQHLHVLMAYDFAVLMAEDDLKEAKRRMKKCSNTCS